jgi:hypothetical protein
VLECCHGLLWRFGEVAEGCAGYAE